MWVRSNMNETSGRFDHVKLVNQLKLVISENSEPYEYQEPSKTSEPTEKSFQVKIVSLVTQTNCVKVVTVAIIVIVMMIVILK